MKYHAFDLAKAIHESLGINEQAILCRSSKLMEVDNIDSRIWRHAHPRPWYVTERDIPGRQINALFEVSKRVVDWINKSAPCNHNIHVSTYRYMDIENFFDAQDICPYCMSYSLWFFHAEANLYGAMTAKSVDNYPFCATDFLVYLLSGIEPYLTPTWVATNSAKAYIPEQDMSVWFYKRGLEVSFIDIVRFTLRIQSKLRQLWSGHIDYYPVSWYSQWFPDCLYSADINDGHLYFYYEHEHPLDKFKPRVKPSIDYACIKYQRFHEKHRRDRSWSNFSKIPGAGLTVDLFMLHHVGFKQFLQTLLPRVERG
jgi:hypothetical protein